MIIEPETTTDNSKATNKRGHDNEEITNINESSNKKRRNSKESAEVSSEIVNEIKKADSTTTTSSSSSSSSSKQAKVADIVDPVVILITGWAPDEATLKKFKGLGATVADDPKDATHVVTPSFKRTAKLLAAINAGAKYIVRDEWLFDCVKAKKLLDIGKSTTYTVSDIKEKEKLWDFNLKTVLMKERKCQVFSNYSFYFLPETWSNESLDIKRIPPQEEMNLIIRSGGGIVLDKLPSEKDKNKTLLVISPPVEIISKLGKGVMSKIEKIGKLGAGKGCYSGELILASCLSQQVELNKNVVKVWAS